MVLRDVPQGGLLLIMAGSPCQELTSVGPHGGELGLTGSQSVLYHAVPAIARVASFLRPDIYVHVFAENAASAKD
eukprot:308249-Lingulodinium_polyedra.AAC.1